ncbi:hypothetical protein BGX24_008705, partial [Mortierella sp. AD032]
MDWYMKAANLGSANAQYQIGVMYNNGEGVPTSGSNAMKWFTKAATQSHTSAQHQMGLLYRDGTLDELDLEGGVFKNSTTAMAWFLKAANKGHKQSLYCIGCMYRDSLGVPQDFYQAMEWFQKAAAVPATGDNQGQGDQGIAEAAIGRLYMKGQGVFHDKSKALDWFSKAAEQGNVGAKESVA